MPEKLVSDSESQFTSDAFKNYCKQSGIEHIKTPPFHPQSNGQSERFVNTMKRALKKIQSEEISTETALDTFLQTHRSTPHPALNQHTPAEVLFNRNIRIPLDLIRPTTTHTEVDQRDDQQPPAAGQFQPGDAVYMKHYSRNARQWITGTVSKRIGSLMYEIITDGHRTHRRHANQIPVRPRHQRHRYPFNGKTIRPAHHNIFLPIGSQRSRSYSLYQLHPRPASDSRYNRHADLLGLEALRVGSTDIGYTKKGEML